MLSIIMTSPEDLDHISHIDNGTSDVLIRELLDSGARFQPDGLKGGYSVHRARGPADLAVSLAARYEESLSTTAALPDPQTSVE